MPGRRTVSSFRLPRGKSSLTMVDFLHMSFPFSGHITSIFPACEQFSLRKSCCFCDGLMLGISRLSFYGMNIC